MYPLEVAILEKVVDPSTDKMAANGIIDKICSNQKSLRSVAVKCGVSEEDFNSEAWLNGQDGGRHR